jgi:two-component system, chemotaxis family, chemotaxis protein CheY
LASKPQILVVDDSATARAQLCPQLVAAGFEVVEASDGSEGLWRAREKRFDLILTDIHMPAMDGLAFVQRLRELADYQDVPVVALTSDGARARREEGRRLGIRAWVLKPPDVPALVLGLRRVLARNDIMASRLGSPPRPGDE